MPPASMGSFNCARLPKDPRVCFDRMWAQEISITDPTFFDQVSCKIATHCSAKSRRNSEPESARSCSSADNPQPRGTFLVLDVLYFLQEIFQVG